MTRTSAFGLLMTFALFAWGALGDGPTPLTGRDVLRNSPMQGSTPGTRICFEAPAICRQLGFDDAPGIGAGSSPENMIWCGGAPPHPCETAEQQRTRICTPGFSATIRPSVEATNIIKRAMLRARGIPQSRISDYELDHIVPLCLDGAPLDMSNLQLQLWPRARAKDHEEAETCRTYCAGEIEMPEARGRFARDPE